MAVGRQHRLRQVQQAVARRLRARQRAAVRQAFAREHTFITARQALILAVEIADFARARADVARRNVHIRADIPIQFGHEALAECHHLAIALALRIEIAAALAAADGQAGQGVFENLLKAKEFDDAQIHTRMQAQAALIRADGAGKLHAERVVDLHLALVIHPRHAEKDLALRHGQAFKKRFLAILLFVALNHRAQGIKHLANGLMKLRLAGIFAHHALIDLVNVRHGLRPP